MRPPAPPEQVAQGQQIFRSNCSFCHGSDARGGETGPNLVRDVVVLRDQDGELITPIVQNGIPARGMPSLGLSGADITDIAAWLHSQPLSDRGTPSTLDILVGDAKQGEAYFNGPGHCTQCHSATGDFAGIGSRDEPKTVQNLMVSGGGTGFGRRSAGSAPPPKVPARTVTVTLPSGRIVRGELDHNTVAGSLVSPDNGGATNWHPPSYDPRTGLLYVVLREIYAMYYLTDKDPRMLVGLGGSEQDVVGSLGTSMVAIDYRTGKLAWKYRLPGGSGGGTGLLTTAGGLLFAHDGSGSLVAFGLQGRRSPVPLWHAQIGSIENAPETYTVDGRQYVLVTAEGAVWAFSLQ